MTQRESAEPVLLIDDGGPAALVACLLASKSSSQSVTLWFPSDVNPCRTRRLKAAQRCCDLLGLGSLIEAPTVASRGGSKTDGSPHEAVPMPSHLLFDAACEAVNRGAQRLIWPCQFGDDLDQLAACSDRARLVTTLIELDLGPLNCPGVRIDTPLIDLTDEQLADLARDLDAPIEACWWCEHDEKAPCGQCDQCRRWRPLLRPLMRSHQDSEPLHALS